ncbi:MAG: tetratricopeptide repeat protein [Deltaproteobacteria bacterium]|nr:tetratricopeptide repeat protein [Deltaproteobacteria bacterium]
MRNNFSSLLNNKNRHLRVRQILDHIFSAASPTEMQKSAESYAGEYDEEFFAIVESIILDLKKQGISSEVIGELHRLRGMLNEITKEYNKDKTSLEWYNKGAMLAQLGKHQEALNCYEKAQDLEPDHPWTLYGMGTSWFHLKDYDKALYCLEGATQIAPEMLEAWVNKAYVLREKRSFNQAIKAYKRAAELAPQMPQIWDGLGGCYYELQYYDEVIECTKKAIKFAPQFYSAWNNQGGALLHQGKIKEAKYCFQKALEIKSDYPYALKGLEACEHLLGQEKVKRSFVKEKLGEIQIGQVLKGRYEVRSIHKGGMGVVYGAWDRQSHTFFALKTFRPRFFFNQRIVKLFLAEADVWIKLGWHTHIVRALWVELIHECPFLVLEYIEGESLRHWIGSKNLTLIACIDFAIQFCTGMMYVNEQELGDDQKGLVHRDIKPENILINKERTIKITDFGLAKTYNLINEVADLEIKGVKQSGKAGTPMYMSPEQLHSESTLDVRSDIYAFGVVLYEILTKTLPFQGYNFHDLLNCIERQEITPPSQINSNIPVSLSEIALRCLKYNQEERYASFRELREFLLQIYQDMTSQAYLNERLSITPSPRSESSSPHFTLIEAVSLARLGRLSEAQILFERILTEGSPLDKACAWYNMALILRNQGELEEAIKLLSMAEDYADDPELRASIFIGKAAALDELRRFEEAIATSDLAISLANQVNYQEYILAAAWGNKANALKHLQRFDEALICYNEGLRYEPNDEKGFYNRGHLFRLLERWEEALHDQEQALHINPRSVLALSEKGFLLLLRQERYSEALECFQQARIVTDRNLLQIQDQMTLYSHTFELEHVGRYKDALWYYEVLTLISPNNPAYWIAKGSCLLNLGQYEASIKFADRAIDLDADEYMPWINKAVAYHNLGNYKDALKSAEKVLQLNPDHKNAKTLCQLCRDKLDIN